MKFVFSAVEETAFEDRSLVPMFAGPAPGRELWIILSVLIKQIFFSIDKGYTKKFVRAAPGCRRAHATEFLHPNNF
jgi:hypothetical protein